MKHYSGVEEAIVIPHEDTSGDKKLVAYILTHDTESVNAKDLRLFLKKKLPDYMVPSAFFVMDDMPLTSNGKLDRKALLANQDLDRCSAEFTAPQTDTEKKLAKVWVDILNISRVGIYDNFFELGGHSLLATKLASTIKESFSIDIDLPTLFKMSSLKDLAAYIDVSVAALKGSSDDDKPQGNRVELEF